MTTEITVPAPPQGPGSGDPVRSSRRRRVVRSAVAVTLLAAVGVGLGFWRYAASYAPLNPGPVFGPFGSRGRNVVIRPTDLGDELYLRGPAGTEGTVLTEIDNDGSHEVTVQGALRSPYMVSDVRWSPYVVRNGGSAYGVNLPLRELPAHIAPHGTIRVVLTLRKPKCVPGGAVNTDYALLYWESMGVHHEYEMPIEGAGQGMFVGCPRYIVGQAR